MKTGITKTTKGILLTLGLGMFSFAGFAQEHITLSLENLTATNNTIEYDLFVINDGSTTLNLAACAFGANYNGVIMNGATPSFTFVEGTKSQALNGLNSYSILNTNNTNANQMRLTMKPATKMASPVLLSNVPYKVGHFKLTNAKAWTSNSNPAISLNEFNVPGISTSCATAYVDGAANPKPFSTALKNLKVKVVASPILNPIQGGDVNTTLAGGTRTDFVNANNGAEISKQVNTATSTKINMFPNPTQDVLNIDLTSDASTSTVVKVCDIRGRVVKQIQARTEKGSNSLNVSLREVPAGVYTVQVYQDNSLSFTDKVTKKD